jgi:hypothetical protein
MNTLAHRPAAFELRTSDRPAARSSLFLRPTEDGWSLVGPGGELVHRGLGTRSRRECLEYARDHGVISVFS